MKDWKKAMSCVKPEEFDEISSPTTVYQRRNIETVVTKDSDGNEVIHYEYEERTMSHDEYVVLNSSNIKSTIEYIALMTGVELEGVI